MAREYAVRVEYTQFPLHPDTPAGGLRLADLFRGRNIDLPAMNERMRKLCEAEGLAFVPRDKTFNSRLAQELGKWGERAGRPEIHGALFRAYWVEGTDIESVDALVAVAASVGLPADEARRVLTERTERAAVDEDWARARAMGVTGVPTFVAERYAVVGAQPYPALERLVQSAGGAKRAG